MYELNTDINQYDSADEWAQQIAIEILTHDDTVFEPAGAGIQFGIDFYGPPGVIGRIEPHIPSTLLDMDGSILVKVPNVVLNDIKAGNYTEVSYDQQSNTEAIHRATSPTAAGAVISRNSSIEIEMDLFDLKLNIDQGKNLVSFEDTSDQEQTTVSIDIETEDESDYNCPVCGRTIDTTEWDRFVSGADRSGGIAVHSCPTEDCDGEASLFW